MSTRDERWRGDAAMWADRRANGKYLCGRCGLLGPKGIRCPQSDGRDFGENVQHWWLAPVYSELRELAFTHAAQGFERMNDEWSPALAAWARAPWVGRENEKEEPR